MHNFYWIILSLIKMFIFCDEWIPKLLFFFFLNDERFYDKVRHLICLMLMLKLDIAMQSFQCFNIEKHFKWFFFFFKFSEVRKFDLTGQRRAWFKVCSTRPQQVWSGAIVNSRLWKFFKYINGLGVYFMINESMHCPSFS